MCLFFICVCRQIHESYDSSSEHSSLMSSVASDGDNDEEASVSESHDSDNYDDDGDKEVLSLSDQTINSEGEIIAKRHAS